MAGMTEWTVPAPVPPGATLLDLLREAGLRLPAVCAGRGACGGCVVRIDPPPPPSAADRAHLSAARLRDGWRLSCTTVPAPGAIVRVPLPGSDRPPAAASLPRKSAGAGRRGRSAAPAAASVPVALAVDTGTTTVACALVARPGGEILSEGASPNAQAAFGGDVVARIEYAMRGKAQAARLREALAESIMEAARDACRAAGVAPESVAGGALAGNPTMVHLLAGADPAPLGRAPFRLVLPGVLRYPAGELGFPGTAAATVEILPAAGVTIGGDATGGAVALGMDRRGAARLLVDVGTNTEMVLSGPAGRRRPAGTQVRGASAASGGAFEGASISCGMRAGAGAVTGVAWEEGDLRLAVAGNVPPRGLSGSGLIDLAALLLRFGILEPSGRMRGRTECFGVPPPLLGRLVGAAGGEPAFLVAREGGRTVTLTAGDVRRFQLAKGAVRAALGILLEESGLEEDDVAEISLAGAFGGGIAEESALATGLFPSAFRGRLRRAGNAALLAAVEAVRSPAFVLRVARFARRLRPVALPDHPAFASRFLDAVSFPAVPGFPSR